jgi:hypothetical protein
MIPANLSSWFKSVAVQLQHRLGVRYPRSICDMIGLEWGVRSNALRSLWVWWRFARENREAAFAARSVQCPSLKKVKQLMAVVRQ